MRWISAVITKSKLGKLNLSELYYLYMDEFIVTWPFSNGCIKSYQYSTHVVNIIIPFKERKLIRLYIVRKG